MWQIPPITTLSCLYRLIDQILFLHRVKEHLAFFTNFICKTGLFYHNEFNILRMGFYQMRLFWEDAKKSLNEFSFG